MTEQKKKELAAHWFSSFTIYEGILKDLEDIHRKMVQMLEANNK